MTTNGNAKILFKNDFTVVYLQLYAWVVLLLIITFVLGLSLLLLFYNSHVSVSVGVAKLTFWNGTKL